VSKVIDQMCKGSISVSAQAFSAATDLFVIHTNDFFGATVALVGAIAPISLSIAQIDQVTLQDNDHIPVSLLRLDDATVTGTATAFSENTIKGNSDLLTALAVAGSLEISEAFTVDVMCGTLTTSADATYAYLADGWNVQQPYLYVWGDDQPIIPMYDDGAGTYQTALAVRLGAAPSAAIDINATFTFAYWPGTAVYTN
jgi:hypothetical protein